MTMGLSIGPAWVCPYCGCHGREIRSIADHCCAALQEAWTVGADQQPTEPPLRGRSV